MAVSATHKGWRFYPDDNALVALFDGVENFRFAASDILFQKAATFESTVSTGATTLASATTTGNHTFSSTITAGADGVGTDGEQLTSGGAGAECDWAAAGSLRQFKKVLGIRDDAADALKMIAETPVYDFKYRPKSEAAPGERITNTGDVETVYTGIMADEAPWAMHHNGRILNPINTFGYTMLAIKALLARVEDLEGQLKVARA